MQQFQEIAIIGMGLIGGSLALALKKSGYKGKIMGCDASMETLRQAKDIGAVDGIYQGPKDAVKDADLVILAVPVGYYVELFQEVAPYLSQDVVVTDVGSVKGYVKTLADRYLPKHIQFLGGHPMAGSEKGGIKAATPFLFENAYYFLTPNTSTKRGTIEKIENLVKSIGAYPVVVEAQEHDKIAAQISHVPHLAAVLVANLLEERNSISYIPFVGGGFRDTTRIAAGNPRMWKDIFFYNKEELLAGIESLEGMLQDFKRKLLSAEGEAILGDLEKAKKIRDSIPHTGRDYIPPIYDLIIDVEDRPGVLSELTQVIGGNEINIKEIEILHAREGELGAVRVGFASKLDQEKAFKILETGGFPLTYRK
ncbi:prephenate dehydrogenase/arogenate dehydrogenase family protein [Anaerosolibacter sp.]|uniref:prephenate dehydrogenase/arogenate dehydrogenase family protein n=1 Tax=Anaerosolibacter sp. TaxID=1872527 RepID=UPI0039EEA6B0